MKSGFSLRKLTLPLVPFYRMAIELRALGIGLGLEPVRRLRSPVVSIGNLSTGGTGKTPLTIALARLLNERGLRVDVLSRGYGRQSKLAARVKPDGSAEEFGDEPLLIVREAGIPVYVAGQRHEAGLLAEAEAAVADRQNPLPDAQRPSGKPLPVVHLLDDGFQHRQLHRDVDILLVDRQDWQDGLLPAGNLREPLNAAHRATVIAIPAEDSLCCSSTHAGLETALRRWGWQGPLWRLHRMLAAPVVSGPVVAFCGIARPEQFFAGLEGQGLQLAARLSFPDHYGYTASVLELLFAEARTVGAKALVTTEKDMVRLGWLTAVLPQTMPILTARLQVEIEEEGTAIDWLMERLGLDSAQPCEN